MIWPLVNPLSLLLSLWAFYETKNQDMLVSTGLNRSGAGGENRTRVISLEGWSNTIIRHPRGHNPNNLDWFVKPRETLWWDPLGNKTHGVLVTLPNATGHLIAQQKLPLRREYATTLGIFIASGYVEGR